MWTKSRKQDCPRASRISVNCCKFSEWRHKDQVFEQNGSVDNLRCHAGQCVPEEEVETGREPQRTRKRTQADRLLVLEALTFLVPELLFLCYNFILTSKDVCTAFDYYCVSVGLGIITVVTETWFKNLYQVPILCSYFWE